MRTRLAGIVARLRGDPPVVYSAPGRPAAVALSFDDGPSEWTAGIAAGLEAHGCRGTFFLRGPAVEARPEVVGALATAGHELGNHLWSHGDPGRQSRAVLAEELERTAAAIDDAGGVRPILVRPPYCGAPRAVARAARGSDTSAIVLRSVDPADWSASSAEEIFDRVMAAVGPGDIVCLHDGMPENSRGTNSRAATVAAVERLVPALLERRLRPVTVSELLA